MTILFLILMILASALLGIIVLIQNPKGGGLSGSFGGFGNQIMGVKQTNDVLEKGTWLFAGIVGILCITSTFVLFWQQQYTRFRCYQKPENIRQHNCTSNNTGGATQPNAVPFDSTKK
jgi:preprotein translocase subunit SecG